MNAMSIMSMHEEARDLGRQLHRATTQAEVDRVLTSLRNRPTTDFSALGLIGMVHGLAERHPDPSLADYATSHTTLLKELWTLDWAGAA